MEQTMAYVFLGFILLFAAVSIRYLVANDFARETLEVLFPAIGAIFLCFYLGVKSIWIDAPQPKIFGTSVAVLHDSGNGQIHGMALSNIKYLPTLDEFRGVHLIDTLPLYDAFKTLDFSKTLREVSHDLNCPANVLIEQIVEYALLQWLCNLDVRVGYHPAPMRRLILSAGGGGFVRDHLVETAVSNGMRDMNPLLKALPIMIPLPKGSRVVRSDGRRLSFKIQTRHTTLEFRQIGSGIEVLDTPRGNDAERIYSAFRLPKKAQGLRWLGFNLEITATQKAFPRFSKQAKLEAEWVSRLQTQFERDFSWERLRAIYTGK